MKLSNLRKVCAFKIVLLCLFSFFFLNFASSFQSLTHFIFLCLTELPAVGFGPSMASPSAP